MRQRESIKMEYLNNSMFDCSRCGTNIHPQAEPIYACRNSHLACEECKKVFCPICRHDFADRSEALRRGELDIVPSARTKRIRSRNPYEPNDGTIEFGESFLLPKRGQCRFYAAVDDREFRFDWKINPQAGVIEVDVSPRETVNENWFIVEFALPSDENRKMKKEWAVNHRLVVDYHEVEEFYEMDSVLCKIHVHGIPYGSVVKPLENKVLDAFKSIFKSRSTTTIEYETL